MKLTKQQKEEILKKIEKNLDKRSGKTDIIGLELIDKPSVVGVALMRENTNEKPPKWFLTWALAFEKKMDERFDKIETRLEVLEQKVEAIMECPTIKKELKLKK